MLHSCFCIRQSLFLLFTTVLSASLLPSCGQKENQVVPRPYSRVKTLPVEESAGGVTFRGDLYYYGPARIDDHGFEWKDPAEPTTANTYRHSLGPKEGTGTISALITSSLEPGRLYYLRAYAKAGNHTVYGNEIRFDSKGSPAPVIEGVLPARITFNDTITIRGKHFNMLLPHNKVRLNEQEARVLAASDTELRVKVPLTLIQAAVKVSVKTGERYVSLENAFRLAPPVIAGFSPESGSHGTLVTITGANFNPVAYQNRVQFGDQASGDVLEAAANRLVVRLFYAVQSTSAVPVKVTVAGQTATAATSFNLINTR